MFFLLFLMLLHLLILLPFASVSTEIRLASLEIWTVMIAIFLTCILYGIFRPPFIMYVSNYCPFLELKIIVCTMYYDSSHKKNPMRILWSPHYQSKLNSAPLHKAAKRLSPENQSTPSISLTPLQSPCSPPALSPMSMICPSEKK